MIGLALIARNEEPALPGLLDSLMPPAGGAPWLTAAVLLDTGSTDQTPAAFERWARTMEALAASAGQPWAHAVERAEWPNDFAAARTASYDLLERTAGPEVEWFVWADADDEIIGGERLPGIAEAQGPDVAMVIFDYDYAQSPAGACICRLRRERLTRRGQTEWTGRVHEAQIPTVPAGAVTVPPEVAHWKHRAQWIKRPEGQGRDPDRNPRILRAWLKDEPDNPRVLGYLGREALARQDFASASKWFRRYLKLKTGWDEERAQVHRHLSAAWLRLGKPDKAEASAFDAMRVLPHWPDSYLTLAEVAYERKEWAKVEAWAARVVELGVPQTLLIINPLDYTAQPLALLAEAAAARQEWDEAAARIEAAMQHAPDPDAERRLHHFKAQAKRERTAETYALMIEQHVQHDEQLKALAVAEAAPYFVQDHPAVVAARARVRSRLSFITNPEAYEQHYAIGGSKPEDMIPDDRVDAVAGSLPRAHFALARALELAEQPTDEERDPVGLRILDLGCHDGFIAAWLIRQLHEGGAKVARYDGVELQPDAAAAAARRIEAEGVQGSVLVDKAEEARVLFDPGTYDLVLAFEVIEHVPDVDEFLLACEAMVNPGGLVLLSTPDGTFGHGGNPHHLRTYRAADLADVARRRGRPDNAESGRDGIVTVAYEPAPRDLDLAIYTGPGWEPWSPFDIKRQGLGGSETAAVRLAEELDDAGHVVTVYGEVKPMMYRGVLFKHHTAFDPTEPRDGVILSRQPAMLDHWIAAPARMLWVHDVDCGPALTEQRAGNLSAVVCLSDWQEQHLREVYPWLDPAKAAGGTAPLLVQTRNGVNLPYFQRAHPEAEHRRRPRVLYTSSPDRGLDVLLDLWPAVRESVPNAELAYCYTTVYDAVARQQPEVAALRDRIGQLADQPGVVNLGALSQPDLAQHMMGAVAWCHPSWASLHHQPFHETYCIGAQEARCAGLVRVGSGWGALLERGLEVPVPAEPVLGPGGPGPEWRSAFIAGLIRALTDTGLQAEAQGAGLPSPEQVGWGPVAQTFVEHVAACRYAMEDGDRRHEVEKDRRWLARSAAG